MKYTKIPVISIVIFSALSEHIPLCNIFHFVVYVMFVVYVCCVTPKELSTIKTEVQAKYQNHQPPTRNRKQDQIVTKQDPNKISKQDRTLKNDTLKNDVVSRLKSILVCEGPRMTNWKLVCLSTLTGRLDPSDVVHSKFKVAPRSVRSVRL